MKENMRDLAGLFVLPFMIALLPWPLGKVLAVFVARRPWFYHEEAVASLAMARPQLPISDDTRWLYEYRLVRLMDDVDLYLWILRGDSWLRRNVLLKGKWPAEKSFVSVTFHWGGGIWALRSMRDAGVVVSGLAVSLERKVFKGAWVRYWYMRLRNRETAKIIGGGLNFTGSAARQLYNALRADLAVCGLFDVPGSNPDKDITVRFFGRESVFPRGLAHIAVQYKKQVVVFYAGVDPSTLQHVVYVEDAQRFDDEATLTQHLALRLQNAVELRSSAWHHWALLDRFNAGRMPFAPAATERKAAH
jgi:hypothetical protein